MIAEWLTSVLTPASFEARRLGVVAEVVAVRARARRQAKAWAPHLAACHQTILTACQTVANPGSVAVLGAGWLLDVPFDALTRRFDQVLLIDAVVPRAVRARAGHAGALWQAHDLGGVLATLAAQKGGARGQAPDVPRPAPFPEAVLAADLVISANLLSQLAMAPRLWLDRHGADLDTQDRLSRALIEAHLEALGRCRGRVCLISDFEREERGAPGGPQRFDLLFGARPRIDGQRWLWDLAPRGEAENGLSVRHKVMGGLLASPTP
ncbi:hypothetical protein F11_15170 [Rhodospirillum rubrum F11]|uniref:Uncharacterized protein n=2 Tax=Rhodospirillum rubrum TaxID=1085 RepID=Q2RQ39_RHORT|nr:hypothetical protein [Rhodospirillum rubrum]ABC23756.1 conserved hypothetical protein [Rhodospirillum rubrum ATCC 11170]AEO49496.1 hypothetical protein F11_15170 [Rhodospirillum rubrum F11]MBK5955435.1 hypothetical protein [Rhodospirillum rubrum]QXG79709.1 hypothetical protein KUL73_15275 [Rhodospirillum rubrum]